MAMIHAASLEYAGICRWAASVQSVTSDHGTEIDTCDCRDVVPGLFGLEADARNPDRVYFRADGKTESLCKIVFKKPDLETLPLGWLAVGQQDFLKTIEDVPLVDTLVMTDRDRKRQSLDLDEDTSARPLRVVDVDI